MAAGDRVSTADRRHLRPAEPDRGTRGVSPEEVDGEEGRPGHPGHRHRRRQGEHRRADPPAAEQEAEAVEPIRGDSDPEGERGRVAERVRRPVIGERRGDGGEQQPDEDKAGQGLPPPPDAHDDAGDQEREGRDQQLPPKPVLWRRFGSPLTKRKAGPK